MTKYVIEDTATDIGRIGGALLAPNLQFQGIDLQFDTDLFYLDVTGKTIGINNTGSQPSTLYLNGDQTLQTVNLIVDNVYTYNNSPTSSYWTVSSNNVTNLNGGTIYVTPNQSGTPVITTSGVGTSNINITPLQITNPVTNDNINLSPNTNGIVVINGGLKLPNPATTLITTGSMVIGGDLGGSGASVFLGQIGQGDIINFEEPFTGNLLPLTNDSYDLGSSTDVWSTVYANTPTFNNQTVTSATLGGITFSGNSVYSANSSLDVNLTPNGTGAVLLNGYQWVSGNSILNPTANPYTIGSTLDGYIDFTGTAGLVIPSGTTNQRVTATLGTTRYNTDTGILEIYSGSGWIAAIGSSPPATQEQMNELGVIYDLILG